MNESNGTTQDMVGKVVLCKVTKVRKLYFEVLTSDSQKGIVFIKEISDYFVQNLEETIKVNNILYLLVKGYYDGMLLCSFKETRSDFLRSPFSYVIKDTRQGFQNLFDFTNKEVEKWKK